MQDRKVQFEEDERMKKVVSILLAAMMLVSMTAFAAELTPGTYTGSASSVGGPMAVEVTVDENGIQTIDVTEIHDSEGVYNVAIDRTPRRSSRTRA